MTNHLTEHGEARVLGLPEFASWARVRGVHLPYPLDIADVPGLRSGVPDDDETLRRLAAVCAAPRVALFFLRHRPNSNRTTRAVAVADTGSHAIRVRMDDTRADLRPIGETELVQAIADMLPVLPPLAGVGFGVDEPTWTRLLELTVADARRDRVIDAYEQAGVPVPLGRALLADSPASVMTGVLGVVTWPDGTATSSCIGADVASWYEFAAGAVLVERFAGRRAGAAGIRVQPYTPVTVGRTLAALVTRALRAMTRSDPVPSSDIRSDPGSEI